MEDAEGVWVSFALELELVAARERDILLLVLVFPLPLLPVRGRMVALFALVLEEEWAERVGLLLGEGGTGGDPDPDPDPDPGLMFITPSDPEDENTSFTFTLIFWRLLNAEGGGIADKVDREGRAGTGG